MTVLETLRTLWTLGRGLRVGLRDATGSEDPIELFRSWFDEARQAGILLAESMTLATATPEGRPSARMVLLKGFGDDGFVFYTNYGSRKARELEANPQAALVFHWAILQRQVRIEGTVERVDPETSRAYFSTRARGSQVGAWASRQSEPLAARADLEARANEVAREFAGREVPLPPFWGGYRVAPRSIEFWQGRPDRLHDRLRYDRTADGWTVVRLQP